MNTSKLRRFISLALVSVAVLPLSVLFLGVAAHAATAATAATLSTPAASAVSDAPASPAPASTDEETEHSDEPPADSDGHHRFDWHAEHEWHGHHSHGGDLVNFGRDSNLPAGQEADSVVSILGSSSSAGEAGDVVSILGDTRVTAGVSKNAVAILGNTYVDAKVDGNVVAVLGNVELGPNAQISGDVVAIGGGLQRDPAAIVHGGVENLFAGPFGHVGWLHTWVQHCLLYGRPLALVHGLGWAWVLAFACLALYVGLALLFREGLMRCVQTFETQPGQTVLAALITMLLTPVLVVLLCVTVIGIAAVPFVVFGLFCAGLFGKAVMLAWLGRRVASRPSTGTMSHPAVAVLIGGVLVLVLYLVPVLGFLVYKLLGLLGLGAVVYTVILAARAHQIEPIISAASTPGDAPRSGAADAPDPRSAPPDAEAGPRTAPPGIEARRAVTAALPRAGFWIRMGALLLDGLLIGFLMGVLHHVHDLELLVLAAYGAGMWKLRGSTIGGLVFDLQVVRLDGREIDWATAIVRALGCFLSLAVAGLGFFWIAFDADKQAWHDKIAGTVVVRVAKGVPLV